jgi:hypothetical protein
MAGEEAEYTVKHETCSMRGKVNRKRDASYPITSEADRLTEEL